MTQDAGTSNLQVPLIFRYLYKCRIQVPQGKIKAAAVIIVMIIINIIRMIATVINNSVVSVTIMMIIREC